MWSKIIDPCISRRWFLETCTNVLDAEGQHNAHRRRCRQRCRCRGIHQLCRGTSDRKLRISAAGKKSLSFILRPGYKPPFNFLGKILW